MNRLNIGCGGVRPEGWINADKSWRILLAESWLGKRFFEDSRGADVRYLNLDRPWRLERASVDVVYASHVLEHLRPRSRLLFLSESARVLKPGGVLRLVVPDLYGLATTYIQRYQAGDPGAADFFLYWLNLHRDNCYPESRSFLARAYDFWQQFPRQHQTMFDMKSLGRLLENGSWKGIAWSEYGKSDYLIDCIGEVEDKTEDCSSIYVECLRAGLCLKRNL